MAVVSKVQHIHSLISYIQLTKELTFAVTSIYFTAKLIPLLISFWLAIYYRWPNVFRQALGVT